MGERARLARSNRKWNRHILEMIPLVHCLLHYDLLYLVGGNSSHVVAGLPDNVHLASNDAGLTGGIDLRDTGFGMSAGT